MENDSSFNNTLKLFFSSKYKPEVPYMITQGRLEHIEAIAEEIEKRWGKAARKKYDPKINCRSFVGWLNIGYRPKKGEKPIQSVTFVEKKDNSGNVIQKYPRAVFLFYYYQVEPVKNA